MTPNPPVAAPVEERHLEAGEELANALARQGMLRVGSKIDTCAQAFADWEIEVRADERQKAMEMACAALSLTDQQWRNAIMEGLEPWNSIDPKTKGAIVSTVLVAIGRAIRRAFEGRGEEGGDGRSTGPPRQ